MLQPIWVKHSKKTYDHRCRYPSFVISISAQNRKYKYHIQCTVNPYSFYNTTNKVNIDSGRSYFLQKLRYSRLSRSQNQRYILKQQSPFHWLEMLLCTYPNLIFFHILPNALEYRKSLLLHNISKKIHQGKSLYFL